MDDKNKYLGKIVAETVLKHRTLTIIFCLVIMLVAGMGAPNIKMSSDYRDFFGKNNPELLAYTQLQDVYAKTDSVLIVVEPPDGDIFNPQTLGLIKELTERAWTTPFSTRVDSVTNFQHTEANGDDLTVRDLYFHDGELSSADIEKIKNVALSDIMIVERVVSADGRLGAVNINVERPELNPMETPEVAAYAKGLTQEFKDKYPDHDFYLTGSVILNNAFVETSMRDMSTLTPIMYGLILVFMVVLLRSISGTIASLIIIIFSTITAMGMAGWLGFPLSPISSIAPTIVLTLCVANSIHIVRSVLANMRKGLEKRAAIIESLRVNFQPVFLTSITTAIGFLSLNFSDTPPFHALGNISAIGVMAAFLFSVLLLPALFSLFPTKVKVTDKVTTENPLLLRVPTFASRRPVYAMLGFIAFTLLIGVNALSIELNDRYVEYFGKSTEFRQHSEYIMDNFSGIYQLEFSIDSGTSGGINDPAYLKKLDDFADYYRSMPEVSNVNSFSDIIKKLNVNMHGDDQSYYQTPTDRDLAAQYLLLYEMSLPYGLDLNNQINVDKSSTRFIVTLQNVSAAEILQLADKGANWLIKEAPEPMHATASGPSVMFPLLTIRNVQGMAIGIVVAFGLISITLMIALRSVKYGLLSLIPNLVPASIAYGIWGLMVGVAGFDIAVAGSITIGIIVDDTVHVLTRYVRARREKKKSPKEAVAEAYRGVGPALLITTAVLTIGFMVLTSSNFQMNSTLGALSALIIVFAIIADFIFLPAVLVRFDRSKKESLAEDLEAEKKIGEAELALAMAASKEGKISSQGEGYNE